MDGSTQQGAPPPRNIIALVFDFDDTLADDATSKLLQSRGIDLDKFWPESHRRIAAEGWDPTLSYLYMILDRVGDGKELGAITNEMLRDFGKEIEPYPGLPDMFDDLQLIASKFTYVNPVVEIYIISGGLEEIIRGTSIGQHKAVRAIRGCTFGTDGEGGTINTIKRAITFTEKTRYLFEINKGVLASDGGHNPYDVNNDISAPNRRIPFQQMIYVGDGLTDVPCFSTIEQFGGRAYGIVHTNGDRSARTVGALLAPRRVRTLNLPAYTDLDGLGVVLRGTVKELCLRLETSSQSVSAG